MGRGNLYCLPLLNGKEAGAGEFALLAIAGSAMASNANSPAPGPAPFSNGKQCKFPRPMAPPRPCAQTHFPWNPKALIGEQMIQMG